MFTKEALQRIIRGTVVPAVIVCTLLVINKNPITSASQISPSLLPGPEFQKGVCYVTWERDKYLSKFSDASLERLTKTGTNWISIVVTWYQDDPRGPGIKALDKTPSDKSIKHAIAKAHRLGFKVMLKPHVDLDGCDPGEWRGDICQNTPERWKEWFDNYETFITKYAKIAQAAGAEMFCVGTELALTSDRTYEWLGIIEAVRERYNGPLTYAAHWDEEFRNIQFWQKLDYVGIDAYFPLSQKEDPSFEEIKAGWQRWIDVLEPWAESIGKPVLFTEAGYSSSPGAARSPWEERMPGSADLELQKNCYQALFEILWQKKWFTGIYWWRWNTNARAGGCHNKGFTPQNKPAEEVLTTWYKKRHPKEGPPKDGMSFEI
ncbi:MAG: hypothetical protein ABIJ27_02840 [Candidatus Omnitrophota bacterium]